MKKISIVFILLAFCSLVIPATAEFDKIPLGPYNISFDLGYPKASYWIKADDLPEVTESLAGDVTTKYVVNLGNKLNTTRIITISATLYDTNQIATPDNITGNLRMTLLSGAISGNYSIDNIDSANRIIDGHEGGIAYMKISKDDQAAFRYFAGYFATPRLFVRILSSYPWNEGTLDLLKTIHIEKLQS